MKFVVLTGVSGAGKSTALRYLEDNGYLCVDNLPPAMIGRFIELCQSGVSRVERVALAVDVRSGAFFDARGVREAIRTARGAGLSVELLFLTADDESLVRRYKETRRDHPLADGEISLLEAISLERDRIQLLREAANIVIDTSNLRPKEIYVRLQKELIGGGEKDAPALRIEVLSFGFKRGIPRESDLVFDVRFLPNPFYIPEIKAYTGLEEPVRAYVMGSEVTRTFVDKLYDLLDFLLPHYIEEGKNRLMIAIGCTGGAHRSVAIAESLGEHLRATEQVTVDVNHRDIEVEKELWTNR